MIYDLAVEPAGQTGGSSLEWQPGMGTDKLCCRLAWYWLFLLCHGRRVLGYLNQEVYCAGWFCSGSAGIDIS